MCQLTSQMKPNSAQMIDVVKISTGRATQLGRWNFSPILSAMRVSHWMRWVRCAWPTHSISSVITTAASESPITWVNPAPRAGASATIVSSSDRIVVPPNRAGPPRRIRLSQPLITAK